jgi:hypothetical protein
MRNASRRLAVSPAAGRLAKTSGRAARLTAGEPPALRGSDHRRDARDIRAGVTRATQRSCRLEAGGTYAAFQAASYA